MTNKIAVKDVDQFMADYVPVYKPIFPLLLGKSKQYTEDVGTVTNRRLEAKGDIRNKHILPKDTVIKQISAVEGSKIFKKYFLAGQYTESNFQDHDRLNDVVSQVLDEHNKHQDDLVLLGEGTSNATVINNGLFWSGDSNFTLESSSALAAGSDVNVSAMYTAMMATALKADRIAGRKIMIVYGDTAVAKLSALFASSPVPLIEVAQKGMGPNWSIVKLPSDVTPSSTDGWIAVNLDQVLMHYTLMPQLKAQGINEEKMYSWHNFVMGSCMVEVLALYGLIRQPVTFS